jgi:hypothetical protein
MQRFRNVAGVEALLHKDMERFGGIKGPTGKFSLLAKDQNGNAVNRDAFIRALENKRAEYQHIMQENDYVGPRIIGGYGGERTRKIEAYEKARSDMKLLDVAMQELDPYIEARRQHVVEAAREEERTGGMQLGQLATPSTPAQKTAQNQKPGQPSQATPFV